MTTITTMATVTTMVTITTITTMATVTTMTTITTMATLPAAEQLCVPHKKVVILCRGHKHVVTSAWEHPWSSTIISTGIL